MKKLSIVFLLSLLINGLSSVFGQWQTNGSKIYYNNGNMGLGTSNPVAKIEAFGNIALNPPSYPGETAVISFTKHVDTNETWGSGNPSGNNEVWAIVSSSYDMSNNPNSIRFQYWDGSNWQFPLLLEKSGNIGIGTTFPDAKLEVADGDLLISSPDNGVILTSPDNSKWKLTVDNNGNLSVSEVTKIKEIKPDFDISVFPNPTENEITVEIKSNIQQIIDVEIYDISGKMVYMKQYNKNNFTVNLDVVEQGTYILKLKDKNGNIINTQKILRK